MKWFWQKLLFILIMSYGWIIFRRHKKLGNVYTLFAWNVVFCQKLKAWIMSQCFSPKLNDSKTSVRISVFLTGFMLEKLTKENSTSTIFKVGWCASLQELIILYKHHSQVCRFNITSMYSLSNSSLNIQA